MKHVMKTFMVCLVLTVAFAMVSTTAMAQGSIYQFPAFMTQPQVLPNYGLNGEILVDNFEYWDSPYNHGWVQEEPDYPVYGFGLGYATIFNTVLDLQEGSRVLDVYRPSSVFLLGPGSLQYGPYARHYISRALFDPTGAPINLVTHPILSFKFRAPLGIEPFDIFEADITGFMADPNGANAYPFNVKIRPTQNPNQNCPPNGYIATVESCTTSPTGPVLSVLVEIGRGFLDGSWHVLWIDIPQAINTALAAYGTCGAAGSTAVQAVQISASGQMFRLDDITFRPTDFAAVCEPYLFKIGPRYAQIFEPYRYLFYATYESNACDVNATPGVTRAFSNVLDFMYTDNFANIFITDPNAIRAAWAADSGVALADPNFEANVNAWAFANNDNPAFTGVDLTLPVFANPNYRLGNNPLLAGGGINGTLQWNATVNGIGSSGIQTSNMFGTASVVEPLAINPYDGMPTYIPTYFRCGCPAMMQQYGKTFFGPLPTYMLEAALWNAGFTLWPMIAKLDFTPQVFEDIIMSIEVTNGRHSDYETFPISVVNYPVENYPPYIEDLDDQIFYVGQQNAYVVGATDADCFIFSMSQQPATTHRPSFWGEFRTDMDSLTWDFTLNGLPSYQYGPWMEAMIDPSSGLVNFTPKFEGAYDAVMVVTDNRGASAVGEFTIFCINTGTWLNHPPVILGDWDHPQVVRAGEELVLGSAEWNVVDPDGDELYYSCNIGACGKDASGNFIWTFQTNFPGFYTAEIVVYDIRGGYAIVTVDVEVKPWWSF